MVNTQVSDSMLVERFQQGDRSSLNTLIQRHQARAYKYAFRLTRDMDLAADVVAEAFVRVYRAAHSFKGQSAFTTWLYRILTNCFIDLRKKSMARQTLSMDSMLETADGQLDWQLESKDESPHSSVERLERESVIRDGVDRLPEYQRAMLIMYHVETLSYDEIAEALDLPIGTVKSRLNRARNGLRSVLNGDAELFQAEAAVA